MTTERVEQASQSFSHLSVRIQLPITSGTAHVTCWQRELEVPLAGLVPTPFVQSRAQSKQFRFRQSPFLPRATNDRLVPADCRRHFRPRSRCWLIRRFRSADTSRYYCAPIVTLPASTRFPLFPDPLPSPSAENRCDELRCCPIDLGPHQ